VSRQGTGSERAPAWNQNGHFGGRRPLQIDANGIRLWFEVDGPALVPDGSQIWRHFQRSQTA